ncbi:MAG: hypothetical protein EBZ46_02965 [Actinobacteria bacterium]|nr:hypothetical protein [Actinomycetota bacterium]
MTTRVTSLRLGWAAVVALMGMGLNSCSIPKPTSLVCRDGQSIFTCEATFSDGKTRGLVFVDTAPADRTAVDSVTTRDDFGNPYCITLYDNATATYKAGDC